MYNNGDQLYNLWNQRAVLADCLTAFGLKDLAALVHKAPINSDISDECVALIRKLAKNNNDSEVIERLCFAGLIYG